MANPQHAILTNLTKYQWYTHFSRTDGADLGVIKRALRDTRAAGAQTGVTTPINVCFLFGPTLLADLTDDIPDDFQPYPGYEPSDGKVAKATQYPRTSTIVPSCPTASRVRAARSRSRSAGCTTWPTSKASR